MNIRKVLIPLALAAVSTGFNSSTWALRCDQALSQQGLGPSEFRLLADIKEAISEGKNISFRFRRGTQNYKFEGWVSEVTLGTDREYLVRVSQDKCDSPCGSTVYRLSEIIPATFESRPRLIVHETGEIYRDGRTATQVVGYVADSPSGAEPPRPVTISKNLFSELSVFSDPRQASGARLPYELEDLVAPGSELRLYFAGGERRVRLTIRRNAQGHWSFGDTALNRLSVSESDRDESTKTRYLLEEQQSLTDSDRAARWPAARLRQHLGRIYEALMLGQTRSEFQTIHREWAQAIPGGTDRAEVVEFLLKDQGLRFYLNRGFVREQTWFNEVQAKELAAIKYLVRHGLVFYSSATQRPGFKAGLYSQDSEKITVTERPSADVDFGHQLISALEATGLQYQNGHWVRK